MTLLLTNEIAGLAEIRGCSLRGYLTFLTEKSRKRNVFGQSEKQSFYPPMQKYSLSSTRVDPLHMIIMKNPPTILLDQTLHIESTRK